MSSPADEHSVVQRNRSGFQADHCVICDQTDRPLRVTAGNPNRTACRPCSALWDVVTGELKHSQRTDPEHISVTKRLYDWRDVIVPAQAHGVQPRELALALEQMGAFN